MWRVREPEEVLESSKTNEELEGSQMEQSQLEQSCITKQRGEERGNEIEYVTEEDYREETERIE